MATRTPITKPVAPTAAAPRAKRKATSTQAPGLDQTHAADVDETPEEFLAALKAQLRAHWTRERVVGLVLGLTVSCISAYALGGFVTAIVTAALAATTSLFLAMMIYIIGCVLVMYASGKLGTAVFDYVGSGAAREHVTGAARWVKGLFGSNDRVAN